MFTPRSAGVSRRCRNSWGRISPTRCVVPLRAPIDMTIETGDAGARLQRSPVIGGVELLLRKRSQQKPQTLQLLRIQEAVEQLEVVLQRDHLPLRHVAEIGASRQEDGGRIFGKQVRREVEVQVEACQVTSLLLLDLINLVFGKHHAAFRVVGVRQGQEPLGPQPLLTNRLGRHRGQVFPRVHSVRQFRPHALLDRLAARHGDALGGSITQVVPLLQQFHLPVHDFGLRSRHLGDGLVEILLDDDRSVTVGRLLSPKIGLMPEKRHQASRRRGPPERSCYANCTCESFLTLPSLGASERPLAGDSP